MMRRKKMVAEFYPQLVAPSQKQDNIVY